jgi:hypothetical protein
VMKRSAGRLGNVKRVFVPAGLPLDHEGDCKQESDTNKGKKGSEIKKNRFRQEARRTQRSRLLDDRGPNTRNLPVISGWTIPNTTI